MSASLVGSEMCIRDRCNLVVPVHIVCLRIVLVAILPAPDAGYKSDLSAVSYTHLTLPTICSV
eukprot:13027408-Alexandrium_andersonii.AAC.1